MQKSPTNLQDYSRITNRFEELRSSQNLSLRFKKENSTSVPSKDGDSAIDNPLSSKSSHNSSEIIMIDKSDIKFDKNNNKNKLQRKSLTETFDSPKSVTIPKKLKSLSDDSEEAELINLTSLKCHFPTKSEYSETFTDAKENYALIVGESKKR